MQTRTVTTLPGVTEYPVADGNWDSNRIYPIDKIIIHTEDGFKAGTEATFDNPQSHVSAHYGVNQDGTYDHYVDETNVAYQAGNYAVNQCSIGIEHEDLGQPNAPRPDALYEASARLVADICAFYNIPIDNQHIIAHNQVSGASTSCPDSLDVNRIILQAQQLAGQTMDNTQTQSALPANYDTIVHNSTQWDSTCDYFGVPRDSDFPVVQEKIDALKTQVSQEQQTITQDQQEETTEQAEETQEQAAPATPETPTTPSLPQTEEAVVPQPQTPETATPSSEVSTPTETVPQTPEVPQRPLQQAKPSLLKMLISLLYDLLVGVPKQ